MIWTLRSGEEGGSYIIYSHNAKHLRKASVSKLLLIAKYGMEGLWGSVGQDRECQSFECLRKK